MIINMERSLAFYIDGFGFTIQKRWIPDGRLRWCWMSLDGAALMLQQAVESTRQKMAADGILGNGASLYFQCREAAARGIHALRELQVGNFAWLQDQLLQPHRPARRNPPLGNRTLMLSECPRQIDWLRAHTPCSLWSLGYFS